MAVKPGTEDGLDILAISATILLRLFASYVAPTANFKIASAKVLTYFGSGGTESQFAYYLTAQILLIA